MQQSTPPAPPVRLFAAAAAGAAGALIPGLVETAWLSRLGSPPPGSWWFAVWLHAVCGGLLGAAVSIGAALLSRLSVTRLAPTLSLLSDRLVFGLSLTLFGLPTALFRLRRDLMAEGGLPLWAPLLVLVLLLAAAWAWSLLLRGLAHRGAVAAPALLVLAVLLTAPGALRGDASAEISPLAPGAADKPDIFIILADTLRADVLGSYGASDRRSPALDALADESLLFEHFSTQASWTRPSIATLLSGVYPGAHTAIGKADALPPGVVTIPEALGEAGYRGGALVNNPNVTKMFGFDQGFESFHYLAPRFFLGATEVGAQLTLYNVLRVARERLLPPSKEIERYYAPCEAVNEAALKIIGAEGGGRVFFLHYMDVHDPYFSTDGTEMVARASTPRPAPSQADRLKELYLQELERLDVCLAQLFDELEARQLWDPAAVVFTSDHGEEFFEHGGWWHGTTLYAEQVNVPLILKMPGADGLRGRRADLANSLDLAPTLTDLVGAPTPEPWLGRSLLADPPPEEAQYQFAEEDFEGNVLRSCRTRELKLILAQPGNPRGLEEVELYDPERDPTEQQNLAELPSAADAIGELTRCIEQVEERGKASAVSGLKAGITADMENRLEQLGYGGGGEEEPEEDGPDAPRGDDESASPDADEPTPGE